MAKRDLYDSDFGNDGPGAGMLLLYAVAIVSAFGIVGTLDYQDERVQECAALKIPHYYDAGKDKCVKAPKGVGK